MENTADKMQKTVDWKWKSFDENFISSLFCLVST